jgi:hypothetical protein
MEPSPIQRGRAAVRAVRERLLHPAPDVFADCLPDLELAARWLQAARQPAEPELAALRQELREAEALLRAAGRHYFGWSVSLEA